MRVAHVNTDAVKGGATRAAVRLHQGLQRIGVQSRFVTMRDEPGSPLLRRARQLRASARGRLDGLPRALYRDRPIGTYSPVWLPNPGTLRRLRDADVVQLHWIGDGVLSIEQLGRIERPVIWTLHDEWAFTGGCHYAGACRRFEARCGACPALASRSELDLSRLVLERKRRAYAGLDLTVVTPSRWMAEAARMSTLFRDVPVEVIPYGLDLQVFRPLPREGACAALSLDAGRTRVLFGGAAATSNPTKGYDLLVDALAHVRAPRLELATFGSAREETAASGGGYAIRGLGHFATESELAPVYSTADVFALASREDNLPNVVLEALACGVPAVAFDVGGVGDIIDHEVNGYLARAFDVVDFARGIDWVLGDAARREALSVAARAKAERCFGLEDSAHAYRALYERVTS